MNGQLRVVADVPAAFSLLVRERRPRSFAASGGATAHDCYRHLAAFPDLDWADSDVVMGDERWVPVESEDSNEGMARTVLFDGVGARVHSARSAGPTPAEAATAYGTLVESLGALDFVHLGLGEDGHTASLFPGSAALEERVRLVVETGDQEHPHERLTLTYPALERARLVVFTVSGTGKREALARIRAGEDAPAGRVLAEEVIWLADPAAAG